MDALRRRGISFVNVHPEAMPTVPARNSILGGRRMFPFRGWHDRRGLIASPGWSPLTHVDAALTSAFRRGGYYTAYVTDNPFLGFSAALRAGPPQRPPLRPHRRADRRQQAGVERPEACAGPLAPPLDRRPRARAGRPLPGQLPRLGEPRQLVRRAGLPERHRRARPRGRAARALLHGRGHLRAARALDAAEALPRHVRRPALARPRAVDAALHAHGRLAGRRRAEERPPPHERPVRRRGDDDRRLARQVPRPPPRPEPRARHRDRAGRRPRHPARRARLDGEDLNRALPRAHPGAADPRAPAPPPRRAWRATGSPPRTTWRPRSCPWPA